MEWRHHSSERFQELALEGARYSLQPLNRFREGERQALRVAFLIRTLRPFRGCGALSRGTPSVQNGLESKVGRSLAYKTPGMALLAVYECQPLIHARAALG